MRRNPFGLALCSNAFLTIKFLDTGLWLLLVRCRKTRCRLDDNIKTGPGRIYCEDIKVMELPGMREQWCVFVTR
jgi:hypothetical protein